jgi:hypothetical protein
VTVTVQLALIESPEVQVLPVMLNSSAFAPEITKPPGDKELGPLFVIVIEVDVGTPVTV